MAPIILTWLIFSITGLIVSLFALAEAIQDKKKIAKIEADRKLPVSVVAYEHLWQESLMVFVYVVAILNGFLASDYFHLFRYDVAIGLLVMMVILTIKTLIRRYHRHKLMMEVNNR